MVSHDGYIWSVSDWKPAFLRVLGCENAAVGLVEKDWEGEVGEVSRVCIWSVIFMFWGEIFVILFWVWKADVLLYSARGEREGDLEELFEDSSEEEEEVPFDGDAMLAGTVY